MDILEDYRIMLQNMDAYVEDPSEEAYEDLISYPHIYCNPGCRFPASSSFMSGSCSECPLDLFCYEDVNDYDYGSKAAERYVAFLEFREIIRVKLGI
jgi:hypothetical protein